MDQSGDAIGVRTVVVGAGAMGSLLAARLAIAGAEVRLLGRPSPHLDQIGRAGLTIVELDGSRRTVALAMTADMAVLAEARLIVIAVKTWATAEVLRPARRLAPPAAPILTLQNGLGNAAAIRAALGSRGTDLPRVLTGVTTQAALRDEPGLVYHTGEGTTAIGYEGGGDPVSGARPVARFLTDAGWPTMAVADVERWVWRKLAINAAINPLTALAGVPNRALIDDPNLAAAAATLAEEVAAVAAARGTEIGDATAAVTEVARATGANHSSMLRDVELGLRTEIEAINGAVVAEAARVGVPVPANEMITRLVRAVETKAKVKS